MFGVTRHFGMIWRMVGTTKKGIHFFSLMTLIGSEKCLDVKQNRTNSPFFAESTKRCSQFDRVWVCQNDNSGKTLWIYFGGANDFWAESWKMWTKFCSPKLLFHQFKRWELRDILNVSTDWRIHLLQESLFAKKTLKWCQFTIRISSGLWWTAFWSQSWNLGRELSNLSLN